MFIQLNLDILLLHPNEDIVYIVNLSWKQNSKTKTKV